MLIDGKDVFVYRYGADVDLSRDYQAHSLSGELCPIRKSDLYPRRRSLWFADHVGLAGRGAT